MILRHPSLYGTAKVRRTVCTVDDELGYFVEPLQEEYSSTRDMCAVFDAAFAKLLWLLVINMVRFQRESI